MFRGAFLRFFFFFFLATIPSSALRADDWHYKPNPQKHRPLILVPGIMGTALRDQVSMSWVWGRPDKNFMSWSSPEWPSLISYPFGRDIPATDLSPITIGEPAFRFPARLFYVFPVTFHNSYYSILRSLASQGYRDELLLKNGEIDYKGLSPNCFQFAYDWRNDLSESAIKFHQFLTERRKKIALETGVSQQEVQFDIIALSLGSQLVRYYLQYGAQSLPMDGSQPKLTWAGARPFKKVIFIAPPNRGSLHSFLLMEKGIKFPFIPRIDPAILATMPSLYQLFPSVEDTPAVDLKTGKTLDLFDPTIWEILGWGFESPEQLEKIKTIYQKQVHVTLSDEETKKHFRKLLARARQFRKAMSSPQKWPKDLDFFLFVSKAEDVPVRIIVDSQNHRVADTLYGSGDGLVGEQSALCYENQVPWKEIIYLPGHHLKITKNSAFTENLEKVLAN